MKACKLKSFYIFISIIIVLSLQRTCQCPVEKVIEKKDMTFDHDFGCSFPLFSSLLKKGRIKGELSSKNRDQKSCLSPRSEKKYILLNLQISKQKS